MVGAGQQEALGELEVGAAQQVVPEEPEARGAWQEAPKELEGPYSEEVEDGGDQP
jgi:hypothetical protein